MIARATTRVDVLRDADTTDRDGYGDETETDGPPLYEGIPASIIEQTQRTPDATAGALVPVTATTGRVGGELDVRVGDRLRDLADGRIYAVTKVSQPQSPVRLQDKRMELEHT